MRLGPGVWGCWIGASQGIIQWQDALGGEGGVGPFLTLCGRSRRILASAGSSSIRFTNWESRFRMLLVSPGLKGSAQQHSSKRKSREVCSFTMF